MELLDHRASRFQKRAVFFQLVLKLPAELGQQRDAVRPSTLDERAEPERRLGAGMRTRLAIEAIGERQTQRAKELGFDLACERRDSGQADDVGPRTLEIQQRVARRVERLHVCVGHIRKWPV